MISWVYASSHRLFNFYDKRIRYLSILSLKNGEAGVAL
ncbi:hypothetical protein FH5_03612 [Priestia endophytica]|nr:hypothetical protein FH5_03612 [Priestia endophytica]